MPHTNLQLDAADEHAVSDLGPDLSACDIEPIHIPGAIQSHGRLLIAEVDTLRIVGGAGDLEPIAGATWLGTNLSDLWDGAARMLCDTKRKTVPLGRVGGSDRPLEAVAKRSATHWFVQIEEADPVQASPLESLEELSAVGNRFSLAADVNELCDVAADVFATLTGFDRVMIYRFLDDDSGRVVAERHAPDMHGFLHHHFPASDIPRQARALYVRNRVRVIPDVDAPTCPLTGSDPSVATIDLSETDLRAVSPIHLQYLRNMGVVASASVSIVKDGVLWGLVACHHRSPRKLSHAVRSICDLAAAGLARQIRAKEESEDYRERLRMRALEDGIGTRLAEDDDPDALFQRAGPELRQMMRADGFAILHGSALHLTGECPDRDDVREIATAMKRNGSAPFHTATLSARMPHAEAYRDKASGLLAVTLSSDIPTVLMWFRAEELQVVKWAGDPHKAIAVRPGESLTPRASFAAWSEEVRGRSRAWTAIEVEAAYRLMRALFDARQRRRIRDLNRDLTVAVADKDALLAQQETLLKEVNHRVQNSLQLVVAFLSMQAKAENDATLTAHLSEAQRRLSAVALVHRRLYADDNVTTIDLARYLDELMQEMRTSMGPEWQDRVMLDLAPILISADAAVQVGLILVELVINAQKYAYGGAPGPISIALEQHRARFRLIVADRGGGRTGTRKGFGSRMLDAMVRRLDGTIEDCDNSPGLRVIVSAPVTAGSNRPS